MITLQKNHVARYTILLPRKLSNAPTQSWYYFLIILEHPHFYNGDIDYKSQYLSLERVHRERHVSF